MGGRRRARPPLQLRSPSPSPSPRGRKRINWAKRRKCYKLCRRLNYRKRRKCYRRCRRTHEEAKTKATTTAEVKKATKATDTALGENQEKKKAAGLDDAKKATVAKKD